MPPPVPPPDDNGDFEDLLSEALEHWQSGGEPALATLLANHPPEADKVRQHLTWLRSMGLLGSNPTEGTEAHPQQLGDFRLLEPIGHGGMGIVYRARQESLQREVALKLIRPDQLYFPGARERFQREVELVARMQHPGIVPVYAVGNEGGVPYFAMELVRGATLADVIQQLAERRPRELTGADFDRAIAAHLGEVPAAATVPLFRSTWTEVVLRIGREIAEALEHAHRRGVLHRDVKPSNVLITRAGRVLLLDFGLAGADQAERITKTGSALGSLPYLPPEVLAGADHARDARGDVYSLGATLWELLALRLPYQHSDPLRLRELAGSASRPKLASLNPAVSWDVETVIATALEPEPARRYASASQFAHDLDNLLAHRPIEARKASPWLRLRRWSQRRPALATAAVATLLLCTIAPSLYAVQESRARGRIEAQRDQLLQLNKELESARSAADRASTRARTNFDRLQSAVDTMLTKVGDESLRDIPRMEPVRRELLNEALRFYEEFLAESPDDPALQHEAARVRLRSAEVHALLGNYAAAKEQVTVALTTLQSLQPAPPTLAAEVARATARLATANRLLGNLPEAASAASAAIAAWLPLAGPTATANTAVGLGTARIEASLIAADRGDLAAALELLETSLTELGAWQTANPDATVLEPVHARTLDRHAIWLMQSALQTRDRATGMALLERAIAGHTEARSLWDRLLARSPEQAQLRGDAAQNAVSLALPLQYTGRMVESRDSLVRGVALASALVADFPHSQRRRSELANARANLAAANGVLEAPAESLAEATAARELFAALLREAPDNDEFALGLCQTQQGVALGQWNSGTPAAEVLPLLDEATVAVDRALAKRPDNPTYRRVRRKMAETVAVVALAAADHARVAAAVQALLDPALAPTEPLLAGALLIRAAAVAATAGATGDAERYRQQARTQFTEALAAGGTLDGLRKHRTMVVQLQNAEVAEFWERFAAEHK